MTERTREQAIANAVLDWYFARGERIPGFLPSLIENASREWEKVQRTPHTPPTDEEIESAAQALFYALDKVELRAAARAALVAAQEVRQENA